VRIGINKMHWPVTSLGPGRRVGIWLQGCSIGCPGCVSRDTWPRRDDAMLEVESVVRWCRTVVDAPPDGVTISGGEPFEQPEALAELLDGLDAWRREIGAEIDFLCYSGMPHRRLQREFSALLARLDALIPEPFVERLTTARPWRGSANQPLLPLSPLGRARYVAREEEPQPSEPALQVSVEQGHIWLIGIPRRGDMDRLEAACRERGVRTEGPSWRA
jgi:anaerobic ribonucleoside-triphosphate reductase activating protein